eukprot:g32428.t1
MERCPFQRDASSRLPVLPRALYNAVPKPKVRLFLCQGLRRLLESLKVCLWTIIGWWKQETGQIGSVLHDERS